MQCKRIVKKNWLALSIWEILEKHSNLQRTTERLIKMLTNLLNTMGSGGSKSGTRYGCFSSESKLFHVHVVFTNNLAKMYFLILYSLEMLLLLRCSTSSNMLNYTCKHLCFIRIWVCGTGHPTFCTPTVVYMIVYK